MDIIKSLKEIGQFHRDAAKDIGDSLKQDHPHVGNGLERRSKQYWHDDAAAACDKAIQAISGESA